MNPNIIPLNLPPIAAQTSIGEDGVERIYDRLRGKAVALTPEEWVRQHFVAYLVDGLGYPAGLMANEVGLTLNRTMRRCDTVVYNTSGRPAAIVEYKAPQVRLTQKVFDQIVRYNMVLRVGCLMVSNGLHHYCCAIDHGAGQYRFLQAVPHYNELPHLSCSGIIQ